MVPTSINWHIWMNCNLTCKFCFKTMKGFSQSLPSESPSALSRSETLNVLEILEAAGFEKITFAGGEPTLHPFLPEVLAWAKKLGFTVMLVTNGHFLSDIYLGKIVGSVDAIKISIDSSDEGTEVSLGRGAGNHLAIAVAAAQRVKSHGIPLMLNTVVTSLNYSQNMSSLVEFLSPKRWKVFQALPESGENDDFKAWYSDAQFQEFVARHKWLSPIVEPNDLMRGSYVMLDPIGRFMQDLTGQYIYSRSILKTDVYDALNEVGWDSDRFLRRGGLYSWKAENR